LQYGILFASYMLSVLIIDPVANFHLRNGAQFHRVCWMGNTRQAGLRSSAGMMVNYLYDLSQQQERADRYASASATNPLSVPIGNPVKDILDKV
jgi:hypothetical protein